MHEELTSSATALRQLITDVADFPKPGVMFKDITPLLADPEGFATATRLLAEYLQKFDADELLAIESRGFIIGSAVALQMQLPMHLVRKPGKLPRATHSITYELEYGHDTLELHQDVIQKGRRYAIIDDVIATGGTAGALAQLVLEQQGELVGAGFLIELEFLQGRERLPDVPIASLITY